MASQAVDRFVKWRFFSWEHPDMKVLGEKYEKNIYKWGISYGLLSLVGGWIAFTATQGLLGGPAKSREVRNIMKHPSLGPGHVTSMTTNDHQASSMYLLFVEQTNHPAFKIPSKLTKLLVPHTRGTFLAAAR